MSYEPPVAFTVTPYQDAEWSAPPADRPRRHPFALVQAALWLLAAGLYVLDPFLAWEQVRLSFPDDNFTTRQARYSVDGWGHIHVEATPAFLDSSSSGPKYGIVFCVGAALMVVTAGWLLLPRLHTRWLSPIVPAAVGALVPAGVALALYLDVQASNGRAGANVSVNVGVGVYLVLGALAVALLAWLLGRWPVVGTEPPAAAGFVPPPGAAAGFADPAWAPHPPDRSQPPEWGQPLDWARPGNGSGSGWAPPPAESELPPAPRDLGTSPW